MKEWKIAKTFFYIGVVLILVAYDQCIVEQYKWSAQLEQKLDMLDMEIQSCLNQIPGPAELQRRLNRIEPKNPIKVDGRIGPETIAKYERVFCSQSAAATFRKQRSEVRSQMAESRFNERNYMTPK
jgi:hypothetical protein